MLDLGGRLAIVAQDVPAPELQQVSRSRNVMAALLEAAIAAVYLEFGFEEVSGAVVDAFEERIAFASAGHVDAKTELQEALARSGRQVQYLVLDVTGPPHARRFECAATIDGERFGTGAGSTKKAAEQEAATEALAALGVEPRSPDSLLG
jgi:ribonuclease-3